MERKNPNTNTNTSTEKLYLTEKDIMQLGDYISELLYILKDALEGNDNCSERCKKKLKDILELIEKIKKNLHELVDDIYSKKDYAYFSKLNDDYKEREKQLEEIEYDIRKMFGINDNNINRQMAPHDTINKK